MEFVVRDYVETRSDNADLIGYFVYFGNKSYIIYYDKDQLREVYFIARYKNYFMSSRADLKTISHYYITDKVVKRYENGIHNQTYYLIDKNTATCSKDGVEIVYKANFEKANVDKDKLYKDLTAFLVKFNTFGMYELFSPNEPMHE